MTDEECTAHSKGYQSFWDCNNVNPYEDGTVLSDVWWQGYYLGLYDAQTGNY